MPYEAPPSRPAASRSSPASAPASRSPLKRSFRPMSEHVLWQVGLAVHLEAEAEVGAAGHDDRHVDPHLHAGARDVDAALVVAPVALGDVVAVLRLERLARGIGPAAL